MKLETVAQIFPSLQALSATKLPAKAGYRIGKALNKVIGEMKEFEAQRIKLAASIGELSPDGGTYLFRKIDPETKEVLFDRTDEFNSQFAALLDEEADLDLPTITPDDLGDVEIEPRHLAVLDGIVIVEAKAKD